MVIVKLRGGLGNQLFQYALGRNLAVLNQTELKLDISLLGKTNRWTYRTYGLDALNIKATLANKHEITQLRSHGSRFSKWLLEFQSSRHFTEPHFHFYPPVLSLKSPVYLDGYWQSEKYFIDIAPLIRQDLTPKIPLSNPYLTLQNLITQSEAVSVHIRRGDYVTNSKTIHYSKLWEASYYQKAVEYLAKHISNPTFFVFSDDIRWTKAHLSLPYSTYFLEGNSAIEDLWLMASCQHHIIANSTFSWWGAWLNQRPDKMIIAPQKWFSTERFDTKDLLPETWIRL